MNAVRIGIEAAGLGLAGLELAWEAAGSDPHAAGRRAAARALARFGATLGYDSLRPIAHLGPGTVTAGAPLGAGSKSARPVQGDLLPAPGVAVSISHAGSHAVAIAGPAAALGIDLVLDVDVERIGRLAPRYLAAEAALATTPHGLAACFAAKEAGLKALGLGLLDGGMFDRCAVTVTSLDPPRLAPAELELVIARMDSATLAVAYRPLP